MITHFTNSPPGHLTNSPLAVSSSAFTLSGAVMANLTITSVPGIRAAALHCGIKSTGKPDLALLVSDVPATAAAVFTQNKVVGAPVIVGRRHIRKGVLRACITNSGCANVCTGQRGIDD